MFIAGEVLPVWCNSLLSLRCLLRNRVPRDAETTTASAHFTRNLAVQKSSLAVFPVDRVGHKIIFTIIIFF